jgi:hypothetical protein
MRRTLSIFLALFFSLGPLAVTLWAGEDDARLPACCRRHGAHHCGLSMETAAALAAVVSGKAIFTPPSTCPHFPRSSAAAASSIYALAAGMTPLPVFLAPAHFVGHGQHAALQTPVCIRSGRAPPASPLA